MKTCGEQLNNRKIYFSARVIPFTIGFVSDDTEVLGTPAANAAANEQTEDPGGIVGFQLMYYQQPC